MSRFGVASKIMNGEKLTESEFAEAKQYNIYPAEAKYDSYLADYYEEGPGGKCGLICTQHKHRTDSETRDGFECGFGFHLEDLDEKYLTQLNTLLIVKLWGADALKEVGKGGRKVRTNGNRRIHNG